MENVLQYIHYLSALETSLLFNKECHENWERISAQYGGLETNEVIAEVNLSASALQCDYSIRVDTRTPLVKEYWYELDHSACLESPIKPCCFVDASSVGAKGDHEWVYYNLLPRLLSAGSIERIRPNLERCIQCLPGNSRLFQIGVMSGRGETGVRLFTSELPPDTLCSYLSAVGWQGDLPALEQTLCRLQHYSDDGCFLVDFDVTEKGLSQKLGINFGVGTSSQSVRGFLDFLTAEGLCLPSKREGVMKWLDEPPQGIPFIQNDISHFKLPFLDGKVQTAKAYLRQGQKQWKEPVYFYRPVLMNLELTTRCPLRCPQCYCDLETGRDMPLETARKWVEMGGDEGVKVLNLSGGETLCYPHLYEVTALGASKGMEVNIAISGAGFTHEVLERLKESGVSGIYVSLNGSTQNINAFSRDGYGLAIAALELLKQKGNGIHTGINWVMHSTNADDFGNMVKLAEHYKVKELAVMAFKPDARHQLPTIPTPEQMQQAARQIKQYKGAVEIQIEECFSPLRALVGQKFFGNWNIGISKGCGAGRDAFSVDIDGRLTPCRHLDYPESWDSIGEYWEKSPVLKELRRSGEDSSGPCGKCHFHKYCRPCMAIPAKLYGTLSMAGMVCPIA